MQNYKIQLLSNGDLKQKHTSGIGHALDELADYLMISML